MKVTLNLIEKNKEYTHGNGGFSKISSIGDYYQLIFEIKTNQHKIEVLKQNLYIKDNKIHINNGLGTKLTVSFFNEILKRFMDSLMHGTKGRLNFYHDPDDDDDNFLGFRVKNGIITTENNQDYGDNIAIIEYKLNGFNDILLDNINKIIDKLHSM